MLNKNPHSLVFDIFILKAPILVVFCPFILIKCQKTINIVTYHLPWTLFEVLWYYIFVILAASAPTCHTLQSEVMISTTSELTATLIHINQSVSCEETKTLFWNKPPKSFLHSASIKRLNKHCSLIWRRFSQAGGSRVANTFRPTQVWKQSLGQTQTLRPSAEPPPGCVLVCVYACAVCVRRTSSPKLLQMLCILSTVGVGLCTSGENLLHNSAYYWCGLGLSSMSTVTVQSSRLRVASALH